MRWIGVADQTNMTPNENWQTSIRSFITKELGKLLLGRKADVGNEGNGVSE